MPAGALATLIVKLPVNWKKSGVVPAGGVTLTLNTNSLVPSGGSTTCAPWHEIAFCASTAHCPPAGSADTICRSPTGALVPPAEDVALICILATPCSAFCARLPVWSVRVHSPSLVQDRGVVLSWTKMPVFVSSTAFTPAVDDGRLTAGAPAPPARMAAVAPPVLSLPATFPSTKPKPSNASIFAGASPFITRPAVSAAPGASGEAPLHSMLPDEPSVLTAQVAPGGGEEDTRLRFVNATNWPFVKAPTERRISGASS